MIAAVVFDFDGVILDTETPDYATWQDVFRSYGADLDLSLWTEHIGWGTWRFDICGHLESLTGVTLDGAARESLLRQRRRRYLDIVHASPPLPGVLARLDEAQRLGLPLGVASSSSRAWVEGHLARLGLRSRFATVKTSDDVTNVKPDPELYQAAVHALGVLPAATLAIEDSAHGVTAARAAGLRCLAVPNDVTRGLRLDGADAVAPSLAAVTLAGVAESLGG